MLGASETVLDLADPSQLRMALNGRRPAGRSAATVSIDQGPRPGHFLWAESATAGAGRRGRRCGWAWVILPPQQAGAGPAASYAPLAPKVRARLASEGGTERAPSPRAKPGGRPSAGPGSPQPCALASLPAEHSPSPPAPPPSAARRAPRGGGAQGGLTAAGVSSLWARRFSRQRRGGVVFGITSNTLVRSSHSSSGPAGGASDGYGLGRGAAGPDRRCTTTAAGALRAIV